MTRRILLIAVAVLILGVIGALAAALHTQAALNWVLTAIQTRSNGALQIGSESGTLAGPITLHDVHIKTGDFEARIQRITLDWTLPELLANRLAITTLQAENVKLTLRPQTAGKPFRFVRPAPPHLPFAIIVDSLTINGMQVVAPQLAAPLQITRISAMARLDNGSWRLPSLLIDGDEVHVQGHADWTFRNSDTLAAALSWKLALPRQPVLIGNASLNGDEQQMQFKLTLKAPLHMQLAAEVHKLFSAPAWQGKLALTQLALRDFNPGLPDIAVQGAARFSGTPSATDFNGTLVAQNPATGNWNGHFALRYRDSKLNVQQLDLARDATHTRFRLAGNIDLSGTQPAPDLQGEWQALPLPLSGKPWLESPHGTLRLQSSAQHIHLSLNGALSKGGSFAAQGNVDMRGAEHAWQLDASAQGFHLAPAPLSRPLPAFDWRLQAHGDTRQTVIERLSVKGFGGTLRLRGNYANNAPHVWHATLLARHLDPGVLFPVYQGTVGFNAQLDGQQGAAPHWSLLLKSLHGKLREAPVSASGSARYAQGKLLFHNVDVRIAANRFRFDGHVGRNTHIDWNAQAPALSALWPGLSGALDSHGSVELDDMQPVAKFIVHATQLRYRDYAIAALDANVAMSNASQDGTATLKADAVRFGDTSIETLDAHVAGSLLAHTLQLALSSPLGKAVLGGTGTFTNDNWQGDLQNVTLQPAGAGTWQANAAWQPRIGIDGISLPQACVAQAGARVCADASWRQGKWQANAQLHAIPLRDLHALLPPGLEYAGSFDGSLRAHGDAQQHDIDLTAALSPGSIHNVIRHRRVTLLDYTRGDMHIHIGNTHTTGKLDWVLRDGGYLDVDTRIAHGTVPKLSGHIRGELHDFALIPALIPDVSGFEGKFGINLALGGTATDPTFNGTARLADGAIRVPRLGLNLTDVVLDLQGDGDHLALAGSAHSGQGDLNWNSRAQKHDGIWHASGNLEGENFRAVDIPEAQLDISPKLAFKLDDRDIVLDGEVAIPYAKLRPRNLSDSAQVSPDQVIVGQNEAAQKDHWRIHTRVRASMGDKVDIAGFGLSGHITGSVLAVDEPGHFTTGSGELQIVDGQYTAYGQKLHIARGRLMFNGGPISNPALDIRALRKPAHPETVIPGQSEQQVGVVVRGTLHDPAVSLFSNPPLPQSSLLSYLLTGQLPATPSQSPLLGRPGTDTGDALAYSGGEFIAQQVGSQIGLSDVSIQNVSTGVGTSTPSLFIGKYLSPRLYISYGTGILQSISTVRIRYTLSTRWMLEAESGAASSADLIYTLEH
ncbi:MAG TPA: translocation/assembly module TamB domain-containing protein [Gammaproteobacteria bacterium]|nr:translocation/assembly module TamB domain-containing protein [Gammaproteobacteria bacterium]